MPGLDGLEALFVAWSFLSHIVLIVHFALRKWRFDVALRHGGIVYASGLLATAVSTALLMGGKPWALWMGGFIHLVWAAYGYTVDYVKRIEWRSPIRWPVFGPYVTLYLAMIMFYWWPLGLMARPLWYVYALLFVVSTVLNVTSHRRPE